MTCYLQLTKPFRSVIAVHKRIRRARTSCCNLISCNIIRALINEVSFAFIVKFLAYSPIHDFSKKLRYSSD